MTFENTKKWGLDIIIAKYVGVENAVGLMFVKLIKILHRLKKLLYR